VRHTVATAIVDSQGIWARKPADFYPTPADASWVLMEHLKLPPGTRVKEPACGDGAMSRIMESANLDVRSSDLRTDSGFGIGGVDFLRDPGGPVDWVITNPPFNIATEFIETALKIAPNVAMLLKSQFWHARGRLELFERHTPSEILPLTWRPAFLEKERGKSPLMDVIWVVWRQGDGGAVYRPLRRPSKGSVPTLRPTIHPDILALLGSTNTDTEILDLLR
jgi:hypothetical protein